MTDTWPFLAIMKPFLKTAWDKSGFKTPTDIQLKTTSLILEGQDLMAESPTGTGKTLAYLLPILQKIDPEKRDIQAVILAPSRELVMQIFEEIQKWTEASGMSGISLIGGANIKRQLEKLKSHPQLVVGTPGRILELIKLKKLKMHEVKTIVLDEGDRLLVPEHIDTINQVVKATLNDRQILLFSATLTSNTIQKAKELMKEAELLKINKDEQAASKVEHLYFVCEQRDKINVLQGLVRNESLKALTFVKDIGTLSVLASKLEYKGIPLGVLHGDSKKVERETALKGFRSGKYPLLLATDVAARGLDIEDLTHVILYDCPEDGTQYVHRAGRTGRLGAAGTVISIVTDREERDLKRIARDLGISLKKRILFKGNIMDEKEKPVYSKQKKRPHPKRG